jgi:uncharacterized protein
MSITELLLLVGGGFFGGLIDSIVGGGGLITVPIFLLILGPVPAAIGTNKIAAVSAQVAALAVYAKNSHVDFKQAWKLLLITSTGAVVGATFSQHLPAMFFKWFLIVVAPVVLGLVFTRKLWNKPIGHVKSPRLALVGSFVAGFYDGIAGPGGGTLMFLVLFLLGGMPATIAMGTGKLANLGSASFSLSTYAVQGNVDWIRGATMAVPIAIGAYLGARYSSRHSQEGEARKLARSALLVVSLLLVARWVFLIS